MCNHDHKSWSKLSISYVKSSRNEKKNEKWWTLYCAAWWWNLCYVSGQNKNRNKNQQQLKDEIKYSRYANTVKINLSCWLKIWLSRYFNLSFFIFLKEILIGENECEWEKGKTWRKGEKGGKDEEKKEGRRKRELRRQARTESVLLLTA